MNVTGRRKAMGSSPVVGYIHMLEEGGFIDASTTNKRYRQRQIYREAIFSIFQIKYDTFDDKDTLRFTKEAFEILEKAHIQASKYSPPPEPPAVVVATIHVVVKD